MSVSVVKNIYYPSFSGITKEIINDKFNLSQQDIDFINIRVSKNRLGFAVLLKTFHYLGYFIRDFKKIPREVMVYLANQLNLSIDDAIRYDRRKSVKEVHIKFIKQRYRVNHFDREAISDGMDISTLILLEEQKKLNLITYQRGLVK